MSDQTPTESHDQPPEPPVDTESRPSRVTSRPRDDERATRKPMAGWDRVKFLILLSGVWLFQVWAMMAKSAQGAAARRAQDAETGLLQGPYEGLSFIEAAFRSFRSVWIFLIGLELARQGHFLLAEHYPRYHRFWQDKVFGAFNRRVGKTNDWNRFRLGRAVKWVFWLIVFDLILAKALDLSPAVALFQVPLLIFQALPFILQMVAIVAIFLMQFVAMFWLLSRGGIETFMPDDLKTRFSDVWGQDHVLEQIQENMVFLEDPESIEAKGGYVPGGILLWGPPGTGKTLMAEAAAGETARPFVFVEPGAFINTFFGIGIIKVKVLFRKLRKLALRYGGVIVFFDEADSLGSRGALAAQGPGGAGGFGHFGMFDSKPPCNGVSYLSDGSQNLLFRDGLRASEPGPAPRHNRFIMGMGMGAGRGDPLALTALLAEISGLKKPRGFFNKRIRRVLGMRAKPPPKYRILIIMATNQPNVLDEALLRPGRIDRIYRVGYPSKEGRKRTYEGYLNKLEHELTPQEIDKLAIMTPYATGASIKDLVNEALIVAIRDGRQSITWRDIVRARLLKSLGPPEDVEYIERERHAVAVHEACHAVAAYRVRRHLTIDIATIEKGQSYLGMVASIKPEERFTQWSSEFDSDLIVSVASLAGERLFFDGDSSSGVSGDLQSATAMAMYMEGYWGMGSRLGSHTVAKGEGQPIADFNMLEAGLGRRVEERLSEIYRRAWELLEHNRREVLAVAHALETHKTLTGDDVEAVIEGKPGPLIDGTIYRDQDFIDRLELYHAQVVTAHKGHSRPGGPMPRIGTSVGGGAGGQAVASSDPGADG